MTHHTNEVRRIVADFSSFLSDGEGDRQLYPFGRDSRLFITGDEQQDGTTSFSLVGDTDAWSYSLIGTLCETRVIAAEFGRLLANGRRLTAEKYLALWREAEKATMPLDQLIACGLLPIMRLALPTSECKKSDQATPWYASPFLVGEGDAVSTWDIPLDRLDHLRLAAQLRQVYWSGELKRPDFCKQIRLKVTGSAAVCRDSGHAPVNQDLFAEAA